MRAVRSNRSTVGRRDARSIAPTVIALVLLIAGAVCLFGPVAVNAWNQAAMNAEIAKVAELRSSSSGDDSAGDGRAASAGGGSQADGGGSADADGSSLPSASELARARTLLESYNAKVSSGEVVITSDPFAFDDASGVFGLQGLGDGLVGSIEIPAMDCELPLYLGASEDHMAKGATVVAGSSAPLGQTSSNCVIAGHRGYGRAAMFRDIEKVSVGDQVFVRTLWEDLVYTVVRTKVIDPSDTAAVGVQSDRDMVTLVTCHPYGYNSQRYVVECERVDAKSGAAGNAGSGTAGADGTTPGKAASDQGGASVFAGLSLPEIEDCLRVVGGIILAVCALVLVARLVRSGKAR